MTDDRDNDRNNQERVSWELRQKASSYNYCGWRALINFLCLKDGRLLEVGANSRLGEYSNKYGKNLSRFSPVTSESNRLTL